MSSLPSRNRRGLCALVALALLAVACGNAGGSKGGSKASGGGPAKVYTGSDFSKNVAVKAPGVTSSEIHVGSIVSKTNPVGTNVDAFNDGLNAYFDMVNAKGGIWGRKIKLTSKRDDQTGNNATEAQAMLSQDNVYAAFIATELFTGASKLQAAGIPTFGWNINAEWEGPKNFFPNIRPVCFSKCPPQPHITPWVAQQARAHKVAVLAYNVPQSSDCAKGVVSSFKKFGGDVGARLVYDDESLAFGQTDYSAQVSKMKSAGVDFLSTCMDYNGDYAVAKEMKKQGLTNKVTFFHPNLYDAAFVKKNPEALEGGIVQANQTQFEHKPSPPGVKTYLDYAKAHDLSVDEMTANGWIAGLQFVNALKAAGPNFTWAQLIGAWNQQTWYTGDGWVPAINWTQDHVTGHSQFECANFVRIHDGKFVPIYDEGGSKPWVCFDGRRPNVWQKPAHVSFGNKPFKITDVQPK